MLPLVSYSAPAARSARSARLRRAFLLFLCFVQIRKNCRFSGPWGALMRWRSYETLPLVSYSALRTPAARFLLFLFLCYIMK